MHGGSNSLMGKPSLVNGLADALGGGEKIKKKSSTLAY